MDAPEPCFLSPLQTAAPQLKVSDARETQRALMPPPLYAGAIVQAAAATRQCHAVGGDFYDYLDAGDQFHVLLGDACGKGTPAALQAALVQGVLAADLEVCTGAASLVGQLNRTLCRRRLEERFVTLFYGVFTPDHRFTYCNAGHCRPILLAEGQPARRLPTGGVPPGLFEDARYEEETIAVRRGDTLVAFSDGISEASRGGQEFGESRILELVTGHRAHGVAVILERLLGAVREFTGGSRLRDDMTALVVRYLG